MNWLVYAIVGYLCGSIPFGLILTKAAGLGDVRNIGSGNIGATNVLRTGNKKIAALTLLLDGLKGFLPAFVAMMVAGPMAAVAAGLAAIAGHIFPVWLKFKGGKGVATGLGVVFGWSWMLGLALVACWLAVFRITRISSASALSAVAIVAVIAAVWSGSRPEGLPFWPFIVLAAVVWITHRANIQRLIQGIEPKSSFSKKP